MKSILIIDDDSGVLETYQMALEAEGYQVWTAGDGAAGIELAVISVLMVAAIYDARHKIIPDPLSYSFIALALASAFIGGPSLAHAPHIWTLLAGPILAAPFALLWLVSKGTWIGFGDAKLALGIGWLLGMNGGTNAIILAFWIGAAAAVSWLLFTKGRIERRAEIPFGPFLMLGCLIVLFFHVTVLDVRELASLLQLGG